jgi:hypothetical protein
VKQQLQENSAESICYIDIPDIKVAQFSFVEDVNSYLTNFFQKMPLSNY